MSDVTGHDEIRELADKLPEAKISPATGIAAIALSMAMKFHDINTVQDGMLYQQYKLEGKNFTPLHLDMVFETALRIEMHLLAAPGRINDLVMDAVKEAIIEVEDDEEAKPDDPG